jgi:hypothetical protein
MQLTNEQEKDLHDAICDAFDADEFARLLRYRLGDRLDYIAGPGPLPKTVFEVIGAYLTCPRFMVQAL